MPSLGTLSARLTLDNSGLERGAGEAESTLSRLGGRVRGVTTAVAKMGVGLGAAGAAMVTALTKQGLAAVDTQAKLARSLDATADGVRAVQIAASDAGVDVGVMDDAMGKLSQRIGEAQRGTGSAADAFERLGLNADNLAQMDADERMATLADAIQEGGLSAAQASDELRQMGIRNNEMALLMQQGGDAIRNARGEVDEYGLSLSEVDAAQVENANDAFSRIGRVIEVIRQRLAVQLAPFIEFVADLINDASKESEGFRDQIDDAITTGIRFGGRLADVIEGVRRAFLLAGQGAATFAAGAVEAVNRLGHAVIQGPVDAINYMIRQINRIPGIDIDQIAPPDIAQRMERNINTARGAVAEGQQAMRQTLMEPMPSTGLEEKMQEIRDRSREAAEQVVADREHMAAPTDVEIEGQQEQDEAHREGLERRLNRMRENLMAEEELIKHRHDEALEELREFREAELLTMEEFDEMERELEEKKQAELTRIAEDGERDRHDALSRFAKANAAIREDGISSEAAALRSGLQTMFGDQKAASLAIGALKRFEAITKSYAWGTEFGGPAAGAAAAATAAAAQAATLSDMSSTSIGGSSAGSSQPAAGSTSAPAQGGGGGGSPEGGTLTVQGLSAGSLFTGSVVGEIAEELLDYQRRGGNVVLS